MLKEVMIGLALALIVGLIAVTPALADNHTPPQPAGQRVDTHPQTAGSGSGELEKEFRQEPTIDLRAVVLEITTDSDAQFEIVVANPTLNGDVSLAGEIVFRVPPGITIYSSLLGGTGGTGIVQAPFVHQPIQPGKSLVFTFFARSQTVGNMPVFGSITYWPDGNMEAAQSVNRQFPVTVSEPSKRTDLPSQVREELEALGIQIEGKPASGASSARTDNPFGWANWFVVLVFATGTITVLCLFILIYMIAKVRSY